MSYIIEFAEYGMVLVRGFYADYLLQEQDAWEAISLIDECNARIEQCRGRASGKGWRRAQQLMLDLETGTLANLASHITVKSPGEQFE